MTRSGAFAFVVASSLAACTTGDTPPNPNGMTCSSALTLTGQFTPDGSRPAAYDGCWGAGSWAFTASISSNTCQTAPVVAPQYMFVAASELDMNGDPIVDKFTLQAPDPASVMNIVKLTQLGNSICEGEVDICSTDGKQVFQLRPDVTEAVGNTITGQGEFLQYTSASCPTM